MGPLFSVAVGVVALLTGVGLLRSLGNGFRLGRLLAATPTVTVAEARLIGESSTGRYVGVIGRIDAADSFLDENQRPLVFQRTRLQALTGRRWRTIGEELRAVPFGLSEGLDTIAVDTAAVDGGLVVMPREAVGTAADVPPELGRVAPETPADTKVRLRVEQLSSVEHATILGVPYVAADGTSWIGAGAGRPLVVCTLEQPDAMRILAAGRRSRIVIATGLLALGLAGLAVGMTWALVGMAG